MRIRSVVVGMDFSEPSVVAARWAVEHFAPDADITLLHVIDLPARPAFAAASGLGRRRRGAATGDRYDRVRRAAERRAPHAQRDRVDLPARRIRDPVR